MQKKLYLKLILLLGIHLLILSRLQFTAWPEMLSFPYFINHGLITYKDVVYVYPPLLINILAILYKTFGYTILVLKSFAWLGFVLNDVLIFLILKKITKNVHLSISALLPYIILQPILEGNMVWPDVTMITPILFAIFFILKRKYFLSGLFLGLALLTKQTALLYTIVSVLYILLTEKKLQKVIPFIFGGLLVGLPFLFNLLIQKSFTDFLNWTIIYPSKYWTNFPGYVQLSPTLRENAILLILFLPVLFLIIKANKKIFTSKTFLLFFSLLLCGFIGVYPRFSFFHFQGALVFLVILIAFLLSQYKISIIHKFLFTTLVLTIIVLSRSQIVLGGNRFWGTNDLALAKTIQTDSPINKQVYLLGLNSNLYALSERLPNTPWLDNFGWYLEIPGIQEKIIQSFNINPPEPIFWRRPNNGNWYDLGTYQPKNITNWIEKNYTRVKEIEKGIWEWKLKE